MHHAVTASLFVALLAASSAAGSKDRELPPSSAVVTRVVACASVADPQQRLACFDREVAAMNAAQRKGDLVAMDREHIRKTRRSLFGLALPDLGVFGDDSDDSASEIQTTLKRVGQTPDGKWIFDLAEGGRWVQLDSREFIIDPKAGHPIRIRRAAMGSYLANVNKQIAVRVRRIQ